MCSACSASFSVNVWHGSALLPFSSKIPVHLNILLTFVMCVCVKTFAWKSKMRIHVQDHINLKHCSGYMYETIMCVRRISRKHVGSVCAAAQNVLVTGSSSTQLISNSFGDPYTRTCEITLPLFICVLAVFICVLDVCICVVF